MHTPDPSVHPKPIHRNYRLAMASTVPAPDRTVCRVIGLFPADPPPAWTDFCRTPAGSICHPEHPDPVIAYDATSRTLWVPLGKTDQYDIPAFRKHFKKALAVLQSHARGLAELVIDTASFSKPGCEVIQWLPHAVELIESACYTFSYFKPGKQSASPDQVPTTPPKPSLRDLQGVCLDTGTQAAPSAWQETLDRAQIIARSMTYMKDVAQLPPNICTPRYMVEEAQQWFAQDPHFTLTTLDREAMTAMGMGAFVGVAQGSDEPPYMLIIEYRPSAVSTADQKPVVLIGKGVTFDSGGLSLKPASAMMGMKYDMSGAAAVLATLWGLQALKWPIPVVGILALSENMVSGKAQRVGDIVKTLSGRTVEITNTDAEGRLLLCDALTYAERFQPAAVIDMATLTGACVVALGTHATGLLGNNADLLAALETAGLQSHDRVWRLPLWEEFYAQMDSSVADMVNCQTGDGGAGTITAACFLARFAENYPWAHLDIAGTAVSGYGKDGVSTGRPIPLLFQFLANRLAPIQG